MYGIERETAVFDTGIRLNGRGENLGGAYVLDKG